MNKPSPSRDRTTNWSSHNAALRKRGSLLIWVDKDMTWRAPQECRPGRPAVFSDAAIQFCLSIKALFKLLLRQAAGMASSPLRLAGPDWPVPGFSTLCRRQKTLAVQIPYRRMDGPLNLLVPSRASLCDAPPGNGQHRDQVAWGWRMAGPQARDAGPPPIPARQLIAKQSMRGAQGASGHGHGDLRHARCGIHSKPRRRQSCAAGLCCRTCSVRSPRPSRSAP